MQSTEDLENIITFDDDEIIQNIGAEKIERENKYHNRNHGIRCAQSHEEFHPSTDINTCGHRSLKLDLWFASKFNYNLYCYQKHLCHYKDSHLRARDAHLFSKYLANHHNDEE
mgnify:CR=1 FL=1